MLDGKKINGLPTRYFKRWFRGVSSLAAAGIIDLTR